MTYVYPSMYDLMDAASQLHTVDALSKNALTYVAIDCTPEYAALLLKGNQRNRKLSAANVHKYASDIAKGQWGATVEPIIVASTGRLLNGQHRLHAVIKANTTAPLTLCFGADEEMFKHLDRGTLRTAATALNIAKKVSEVARFIVELETGVKNIPDSAIEAVAARITPAHTTLTDYCNNSSKAGNSAPYRVAAVLHLLRIAKAGGPREAADTAYVLHNYRCGALKHSADACPMVRTYIETLAAGTFGPYAKKRLTVSVAYDMYNPANRGRASGRLMVTHKADSTHHAGLGRVIAPGTDLAALRAIWAAVK